MLSSSSPAARSPGCRARHGRRHRAVSAIVLHRAASADHGPLMHATEGYRARHGPHAAAAGASGGSRGRRTCPPLLAGPEPPRRGAAPQVHLRHPLALLQAVQRHRRRRRAARPPPQQVLFVLAAAAGSAGGAYEPQRRSFPASSSAAAAALATEVLPPELGAGGGGAGARGRRRVRGGGERGNWGGPTDERGDRRIIFLGA